MPREPGDAVYIISVAAELAGVHPQTLRIYERRGLISPHRTPGGTRRYSEEDLERLGMIQELTADGVNLEGVRLVMEMRDEIERLQKQVSRLRRLLGEAEQRYQSGGPPRVGYTTVGKRNLPDVNRPDLGGMLDR
ncbi:MAG: helix-turn-helix transcriptional regulator [Actinobacteria bacterium]|nr:helix-turn-helix transcriptional regulator [Actinomycetota bacterium]MBU1493175.1 helix-turn-helix transcriptional regulator [Actinomycetota bacterium]MBU1866645.1 helix-turn-helix transcriptional regulator [Actinomycetota bacterium]